MKKLILFVLCVCLFASPIFADEPEDKQPTKDGAMLMCILTGGSWENGVCTKPARPRSSPAAENTTCNPLLCMIKDHGKCINGVCVKQTPTPSQAAMPKH